MGRRRGQELHPPLGRGLCEQPEQLAVQRLELGEHRAIAICLRAAGGAVGLLHVPLVGLAGLDAEAAQELEQPLVDAPGLELVGERRRHREGEAVRRGRHGRVGADDRIEQPLLPERICPVALDVGHVAVQDQGQRAQAVGHERQTATKSSARSRSHSASGRRAKSLAAIAGTKRS